MYTIGILETISISRGPLVPFVPPMKTYNYRGEGYDSALRKIHTLTISSAMLNDDTICPPTTKFNEECINSIPYSHYDTLLDKFSVSWNVMNAHLKTSSGDERIPEYAQLTVPEDPCAWINYLIQHRRVET